MMARLFLDVALVALLTLVGVAIQTWPTGTPGQNFIATWNPVLWLASCGVIGFLAAPFVMQLELRQWRWLFDLVLSVVLAVFFMVVAARISRPDDDFGSVFLVAIFVFLIPGIFVSCVAYGAAFLFLGWWNAR